MKREELDSNIAFHKETGKTLRLNDADFRGVDLRGVDLRGADILRADFRDADLRGADLSETDMRGTNFRRADLRDTNMRGTDLRGADLRDTDMRGTDLSEADLRGANLYRANLGANNLVILQVGKYTAYIQPTKTQIESYVYENGTWVSLLSKDEQWAPYGGLISTVIRAVMQGKQT